MIDWAVETCVAVSALLVLVMLARRPVARRFGPRAAYALWLLPVFRLITPGLSLPRAWLPTLATPQPVDVDTAVPSTSPITVEAVPAAFPLDALLSILIAIWLIGALIGVARLILGQRRYHAERLARSSAPSPAVQLVLDAVTARIDLNSTPRLRIADDATGPLVTGFHRPMIVLPNTAEADFTSDQLRLALLHEALHIRRADLWTASLMAAIRAVFWWHPLAYLAFPRFRADQEAACDAHLIRIAGEVARPAYAATLLRAARLSGGANSDATKGLVGGAALALSLHHPVKERLMTLANQPTKTGRLSLAAALLIGALICAPLSLADPVKSESEVLVLGEPIVSARFVSTIHSDTGETTFMRIENDGTQTMIDETEFRAAVPVDIDKLLEDKMDLPFIKQSISGEPGLEALQPSDKTEVYVLEDDKWVKDPGFSLVEAREIVKRAQSDASTASDLDMPPAFRVVRLQTAGDGPLSEVEEAAIKEAMKGQFSDEDLAKFFEEGAKDGTTVKGSIRWVTPESRAQPAED